MTYEILLTNGKRLAISEDDRVMILRLEKRVEQVRLTQKSFDPWVELRNGDKFKYSMVKGIFFQAGEVPTNDDKRSQEALEWHETCLRMSKYPIARKVDLELSNRILPGLKLNRIELDENVVTVMRQTIQNFFENNPKYPRCPMTIWWPIIYKAVGKRKSHMRFGNWWKIILRNDSAIEDWIKYQSK